MMIPMSNEDIKLSRSLDEWFCFDENQNYVLRKDAPKEIKEAYEKLKKKYPPIFKD